MIRDFILMFFSFSLLMTVLLYSCGDNVMPEPMDTPGYQDLDIVTGLDFFDDNGSPIGRWQSPNHNPGEVAVFPIPNIGIVSIFSLKKIEKLWLIQASCISDTSTMNIPILAQNLNYSLPEIEDAKILEISIPDFNTIANVNFSDVSKGFYRLFYRLESGEIFWYNLYIDPTVNNFPDFSFLEDFCN